jgi:hypothetical protein
MLGGPDETSAAAAAGTANNGNAVKALSRLPAG